MRLAASWCDSDLIVSLDEKGFWRTRLDRLEERIFSAIHVIPHVEHAFKPFDTVRIKRSNCWLFEKRVVVLTEQVSTAPIPLRSPLHFGCCEDIEIMAPAFAKVVLYGVRKDEALR